MDGRPKRPRHYRDTSRRPKGLAGEGWTVGPRAALLGIYVYSLCGEYTVELMYVGCIYIRWVENILTGCCVGYNCCTVFKNRRPPSRRIERLRWAIR